MVKIFDLIVMENGKANADEAFINQALSQYYDRKHQLLEKKHYLDINSL